MELHWSRRVGSELGREKLRTRGLCLPEKQKRRKYAPRGIANETMALFCWSANEIVLLMKNPSRTSFFVPLLEPGKKKNHLQVYEETASAGGKTYHAILGRENVL